MNATKEEGEKPVIGEVMSKLDTNFLTKILSKEDVIQYIIHHSTKEELVDYLNTQLNSLKLNV